MDSIDQKQVELYRRYLLEKADRSPSRLVRAQLRRWVELVDADQDHERDERRRMNDELRRAA